MSMKCAQGGIGSDGPVVWSSESLMSAACRLYPLSLLGTAPYAEG